MSHCTTRMCSRCVFISEGNTIRYSFHLRRAVEPTVRAAFLKKIIKNITTRKSDSIVEQLFSVGGRKMCYAVSKKELYCSETSVICVIFTLQFI